MEVYCLYFNAFYKGSQPSPSRKIFEIFFGEMLVEAKTVLKGKLVKTIWRIEKNLTINFIILIPGGDKQWKK